MSDNKPGQREPTMEEILSSIRRIISENDSVSENAPQADEKNVSSNQRLSLIMDRAGKSSDSSAAPEEDVLDLTEVVDEGETPRRRQSPVREAVEPRMVSGAGSDKSDAAEVSPASSNAESAEGAELISDPGANAAAVALSELFRAIARDPARVGHADLGSGKDLEQLVADMIRPMLKEWLDQNLAPLVENLVRKEIERISRRAEEDS